MQVRTTIFTLVGSLVLGLLLTGPGQATLIDRGGGFIYDDVLDITWTQDANINGQDSWANQIAWAASLSLFDSVRNVTWDDWRLPTTTQPDPSCELQTNDTPPQDWGKGCTASEMGHLFNIEGISVGTPGLFTNIQGGFYWSSTDPAIRTSVWTFGFTAGTQSLSNNTNPEGQAWAVRDGDVGPNPIPEPSTMLLFGSGLAGFVAWRYRKRVNA